MKEKWLYKQIQFNIDLQLFAEGDKTEKATSKKRQDVRQKGQVFQSKDISTSIVLLLVLFGIKILGGSMYSEIKAFYIKLFDEYSKISDLTSLSVLSKLFTESIMVLVKVSVPILAIAFLAGIIASYVQVGFLFSIDTIAMKFDRINPISGLKRVFSLRSVVELFKSILKILIVGYTAYSYLKSESLNIINLMGMDEFEVASYIISICLNVAIRICMVLLVVAMFDFLYQWWEYEKSIKMSKQEVKEEYKQIEGNQEIKSKIKQKQREMSMKRMMQQVPKADVIITNPTHFAVAVKYDQENADAPMVLAKGQDYIAKRIKEVAKENKIEIVENKPLARTLFNTVEVGGSIPPDLYQAVAEVLAFVYSLRK